MSSDIDRRVITFFLLLLLIALALRTDDARTIALILAPVTALLVRIVAFYFPRATKRPARRKR